MAKQSLPTYASRLRTAKHDIWRPSPGEQAMLVPTHPRIDKLSTDDRLRTLMVARVGNYLDVASREKKTCPERVVEGLGVGFISPRTHLWLYFALVLRGFAYGQADAMVEDYQGGIDKPWGLMLIEALQLTLIVLGVWCPSEW